MRFPVVAQWAACLLIVVPASILPRNALAQSLTFTKIIDTSPGSGWGALYDCAYDGSTVAWRGVSGSPAIGRWENGMTTRVIRQGDTMPGTSFVFGELEYPSVSNGRVVFSAGSSIGGWGGVYSSTSPGAPLSVVVDNNTTVPGRMEKFSSFLGNDGVRVSGAGVAFVGFHIRPNDTPIQGVYVASSGTINLIADRTMTVPGNTANFSFFKKPEIEDGVVSFVAQSSSRVGIYSNPGGVLRRVIDSTMPGPGNGSYSEGGGIGSKAHTLEIDQASTFFHAYSSAGGADAIMRGDPDGTLTTIVSDSMLIPGMSQPFSFFDGFTAEDGRTLFIDNDQVNRVLYLAQNGEITKLLGPGPFDGKQLTNMGVAPDAFVGNTFAFTAKFSDGSSAIYLAHFVPEPSASLAICVVHTAIARHRRPKRKAAATR